eukprot:Gregarina_sp_Pseudo_9__215@NODE_113_length_4196_cov_42_918210_g105_i0_p1_GENE_NODE_113_length_4196_cov_42_918210_g105_i0NODE_113_length_4196_cov_42_918210_g105_i0_p1_ORF_typecomplete_len773_score154_11PIPLCX/PF00388_19/4_5e10PIPLCX/PF00388_19/1_6e03Varsurf_PPLC/PF03490_13/1_2e05_NODE_113_length_4196_cov_42_918210_g105_i0432361
MFLRGRNVAVAPGAPIPTGEPAHRLLSPTMSSPEPVDAPELKAAPSAPPIMTEPGSHFPGLRTEREVQAFIWESSQRDIEKLLANWMGVTIIQNSRIWDITIPGTHNSCTYDIEHKEGNRALLKFAKLFIKCQEKSVYEQLVSGVRFLDLRVCKNVQSGYGEPFCAHGGYRTVSLRTVFRDIARFLDEHQTEVLLLSIRRDAGHRRGPSALTLAESDFWVSLYLGRFMGARLRSRTTIGEMVERRQQLLYFYSEIERYLPNDAELFNRNFATTRSAKSFELLPFDSVLDAPPIPRKAKLPPEMQLSPPQGTPRFPMQIDLPRVTPDTNRSSQTSEDPNASALLQAVRSGDADLEMSPSLLPERGKRDKKRRGKSGSRPPSLRKQTQYITEAIEENLATLEDLGTDRFRREMTSRMQREELQSFEICWRGGTLQYAPHERLGPKSMEDMPQIMMEAKKGDENTGTGGERSPRFTSMPKSRLIKLSHNDAVRFRQIGLSKEYFVHPLCGKIHLDFMYASPLKTGKSLIEKSWSQTCENNARFLIQKLRYWTVVHGRKVPRPPFRFRVLAAEVTPPSLDFPQPGTEIMTFWATQSAATLFLLPSGLKHQAEAANKMLLTDFLTRDMVCRVNCITHDFCTKRVILTILFLHFKYLQEKQFVAGKQLAASPSRHRAEEKEVPGDEMTVGNLVADTEETVSHMDPVAIEGTRNELKKPSQPTSPSEVQFAEGEEEDDGHSSSPGAGGQLSSREGSLSTDNFSFAARSTGDFDSRRISM